MKIGFLPSSIRTFVQTRLTSAGVGISYRSASSGCSLVMWMTTLRITAGSSRCRPARRLRPDGPGSAAHGPGADRVLARVVEVDDQADAPAGHPDADPDPVVRRVHQVHVVAAAVRLLALEEEVRAEDRRVRVAGAAAEVLGPAVARVAGGAAAGRRGCRR